MEHCKISIIIPCYNYGHYLNQAINSVLASTFQDFEIIIVNDGSTDPYTKKVLKNIKHPKIKIIHQENKGVPNARNNGIRNSVGDYIMCLDADDLIDPTFMEKAYWIFETRLEVGIVSSWTQNFGDEHYIWKVNFFSPYKLFKENILHVSSLFRRVCWEVTGGYDESMKYYGYEDWEFWIRIVKAGWQVAYIPEALFFYRQHKDSRLKSSRKFHNELKSYIYTKHKELFKINKQIIFWLDWVYKSLRSQAFRDFIIDSFYKYLPSETAHKTVEIGSSLLALSHRLKTSRFIQDTKLNERGKKKYINEYRVLLSSDTRNVLCLFPWLEIGGADKVNSSILSGLVKKSYHPIIVTTVPSQHPWNKLFKKTTIEIFHLPNFVKDTETALNFLATLISNRAIKLIFLSNSRLGYELLPRLKKLFPDIPVISLIHSYLPQEKWDFAKFAKKFDAYISRHIVVANHVRNWMITQLKICSQKIFMISNGINIEEFSPFRRNGLKEEFRKTLGISEKQPVIVFTGRFSPEKQPLYFVKIAHSILKITYNQKNTATFLMIGDGELKYEIRKTITKLSLQKHIKLLGAHNDIRPYLSCADFMILPSLVEGLPIIGLEAMAMGVPIIASNVPGWQELITDGENGFLVPLNNKEMFVEIALSLIENPQLRNTIGYKARQTIVNQYTLTEMINKYVNTFETFIKS